MTLSWDFKRHPSNANNRPRPFATVALADPQGVQTFWHKFVLVDSGSEETLFPRSILPPGVNLDFSNGHSDRSSVTWRGIPVMIWYHEMQITLVDQFHADGSPVRKIAGRGRIGFWQQVRDANGKLIPFLPYPVLGQGGALEFLVFTEYAGQNLFELKPDSNTSPAWLES
jgi:hypothetical protein